MITDFVASAAKDASPPVDLLPTGIRAFLVAATQVALDGPLADADLARRTLAQLVHVASVALGRARARRRDQLPRAS